jgi:hypothetical protein
MAISMREIEVKINSLTIITMNDHFYDTMQPAFDVVFSELIFMTAFCSSSSIV